MKKFIIIAILLISNMGIFGTVNTGGEENTNIQEIVKNETVQKIGVVEQQEENVIENANETEIKQEENKTVYQEPVKANKEIQKEQITTNTTDNAVNEKQETKKTEQKPQENKQQEQKKEQPIVTTEKLQEKKQEVKQTQENKQCANDKHVIEVGNSKKWYNTKQEAIDFYNATQKKWSDKWTNYEITDEEYDKNCPYGYEVWDCPVCRKWTINFYYR